MTLLATAGCGRGDGADPATDAPTAPETTVDAVAASNPTSTTAAAVAPSVVTHEPRIAVPTASGTGGDPQAPPPSSTTIPTRTADLASIEANLAGLDVLLAPIDVALAAEAEARALGE